MAMRTRTRLSANFNASLQPQIESASDEEREDTKRLCASIGLIERLSLKLYKLLGLISASTKDLPRLEPSNLGLKILRCFTTTT